jgi:uncharacterized membrane protein YeaQ/YmgE (transglycosylase-associated protein family)
MEFIVFIIMGGVIGWLASLVMRRDAQMGIFWNIVVGIVGSFIGNGVFAFFGGGSIGDITDVGALVSAFVGAVVLLGLLNLFQRGRLR